MTGCCQPCACSSGSTAGRFLAVALGVVVTVVMLVRRFLYVGSIVPVGFRDASQDPPTMQVREETKGGAEGGIGEGIGGGIGGGGEEGGGGEAGGGGGGLPQCYSSPAADPSEGAWRKSDRGIAESPTDWGSWHFPRWQFQFLQSCRRAWDEHHKSEGPMPYWTWEATNCTLKAVDAADFCLAMEGRKGVLLVGDSLSRLATTTLASILRAKNVRVDRTRDVWSACEGELTVGFLRNDYLDTRAVEFEEDICKDSEGGPAENAMCVVFADDDTLGKYDTLVVNSGAHYRQAREYGSAMELASGVLADSMRRLHGDDALLVVRNTPPGHWGCTERMFNGPVDAEAAGKLVDAAPDMYHWSSFDEHNMLLRDAFKAADGWVLLDAYSPTVLRSDVHIGGGDCLHYCVPGPADHWIALLYNILVAAKQKKEGQR